MLATIHLVAPQIIYNSLGSAAFHQRSQGHKAPSLSTSLTPFIFSLYREKFLHMSFTVLFSTRQTILVYWMSRWDFIGLNKSDWCNLTNLAILSAISHCHLPMAPPQATKMIWSQTQSSWCQGNSARAVCCGVSSLPTSRSQHSARLDGCPWQPEVSTFRVCTTAKLTIVPSHQTTQRWLYSLNLTINVNFRLKNKAHGIEARLSFSLKPAVVNSLIAKPLQFWTPCSWPHEYTVFSRLYRNWCWWSSVCLSWPCPKEGMRDLQKRERCDHFLSNHKNRMYDGLTSYQL